jgi:hypothetical protein
VDLWNQYVKPESLIKKEKHENHYLARRYHDNHETSADTIILLTNDIDQSKTVLFRGS